MRELSSVSNQELLELLSSAARAERLASAEVVAELAEVDKRKLYLDAACSSLYSYCMERLGFSEDEAMKRVRVARLVQAFPEALDELETGRIHITGLFLLSRYMTRENAALLLAEAQGKSR